MNGLLQATILSTTCYSSDTFSATLAVGTPPLPDLTFWADYDSWPISLGAVSPDGISTRNLISGLIDTLELDPVHQTVVVEGRDFSARLIESYSQRDFVNQSASEVVTAIAQHHGLTPVVAATGGLVGRYYGDGYTRLSLGLFSRLRSDWDLVVELARENGFDAYVSGDILYFQPPAPSVIPLQVDMSDISSLRIERNFPVGGRPSTLVRSWNSQDMAAYAGQPATTENNGTQPFLFGASNLTFAQVDETTVRLSDELGRLQTVIHFEMPWDLSLAPGVTVLLTGTMSPFDATYMVDRVERNYSVYGGSTQRLRAFSTTASVAG